MELTIALILFAILIVAWLALPGTSLTQSVEETTWTTGDALVTSAEA